MQWKALESNGKAGIEKNGREWARQGAKITEMGTRGNENRHVVKINLERSETNMERKGHENES